MFLFEPVWARLQTSNSDLCDLPDAQVKSERQSRHTVEVPHPLYKLLWDLCLLGLVQEDRRWTARDVVASTVSQRCDWTQLSSDKPADLLHGPAFSHDRVLQCPRPLMSQGQPHLGYFFGKDKAWNGGCACLIFHSPWESEEQTPATNLLGKC